MNERWQVGVSIIRVDQGAPFLKCVLSHPLMTVGFEFECEREVLLSVVPQSDAVLPDTPALGRVAQTATGDDLIRGRVHKVLRLDIHTQQLEHLPETPCSEPVHGGAQTVRGAKPLCTEFLPGAHSENP